MEDAVAPADAHAVQIRAGTRVEGRRRAGIGERCTRHWRRRSVQLCYDAGARGSVRRRRVVARLGPPDHAVQPQLLEREF